MMGGAVKISNRQSLKTTPPVKKARCRNWGILGCRAGGLLYAPARDRQPHLKRYFR